MLKIRTLVAVVTIGSAVIACKTDETLSVKEALELTADVQTQSYEIPPRTVEDILAVLDSVKVNPTLIHKRLELLQSSPPLNEPWQEIADFHYRRWQAAFSLGRNEQAIAEIRSALKLLHTHDKRGRIKLKRGGSLFTPAIISQSIAMETEFGNFANAKALTQKELTRFNDYKGNAGKVLDILDVAVDNAYKAGNLAELKDAVSEAQIAFGLWARSNKPRKQRYHQRAKPRFESKWTAAQLELEGQWSKAEKFHQEHLRTSRILSGYVGQFPKQFEITPKLDLARNLVMQDRLSEAESVARSALREILKHYGKSSSVTIHFIGSLVDVLMAQGRFEEAIRLQNANLEILGGLKTPPQSLFSARQQFKLGRIFAAAQDWKQAIRMFEAVRSGLGRNSEAFDRILGNDLAYPLALVMNNRPREAVSLLKDSIDQDAARLGTENLEVSERRGVLAMAYDALNSATAAKQLFESAVPVLINARQGDLSSSSSKHNRIARRNLILDAYLSFSLDAGDKSPSKQSIAEAFHIIDAIRGGTVQFAVAGSAARSAIGDPELAQIVRREQDTAVKLATLTEILSRITSGSSTVNKNSTPALREQITTLRSARQALLQEIEQKFPEYAALVRPKSPTVEEVRTHLGANEALISFYVGKKRTYVWSVGPKGQLAFASVEIGEQQLQEMVTRLRNAVDPGGIQFLKDIPRYNLDLAYELYEKLFEPVSEGWKDARHLLVVADGALAQLPISLLPTKPASDRFDEGLLFRHYRSVEWLAHTHSVTMLPSVASLQTVRTSKALPGERRPFVGFGDPYFNTQQQQKAQLAEAKMVPFRGIRLRSAPQTRGLASAGIADLPRLPDTRTEILSVAKSLNADPKQDVFLGERASETSVKSADLSQYNVISFATHGLIPGDLNGLEQPALALSSPKVTGEREDGLLAMDEVMALRLNADWAVLSACNTASADGRAAEAVSGLGRAFFYAGARSLLVSNWPVMSEATTKLMAELFTLSAKGSVNRAEALRQARVKMIDDLVARDDKGRIAYAYAHPIFWAPFVIVGDNGNRQAGS